MRNEAIGAFLADVRRLADIMGLTPMPIAQAAQRLRCGIWECFVTNIQSAGAKDAWMQAVDSCEEYSEDRNLIESFADVLCASEMRAQQNTLMLLIGELEARRGTIALELEKKGKIYSSLGVLLGLSLALLVI